jgi:caa(3)-type oxidase subunit IV
MAGHKHPNYIKIYITLVILFIVSVTGPEIAKIFGLEGVSRTVLVLTTAFGIAIWKAYLVCAYFMHLKFEKIYAPYILLSCLSLVALFFFGSATDVMFADGHNWEKTYSEEEGTEEAMSRSHGGHAEGDHDGEHNEDGDKDSH